MLRIGFDFDNTLVNYDEIFYKLALERDLIHDDIEKNKIGVRNYLRAAGKDEVFTLMQGEVYGKKILDITPSSELIDVLKVLRKNGHELFIISHKTRTPFLGPNYDLHAVAMKWLEVNNFFNKNGPNFKYENVFFEETMEKKIERISSLSCDVFIDDLPEVLGQLDEKIECIYYNVSDNTSKTNLLSISEWQNLIIIIENLMK